MLLLLCLQWINPAPAPAPAASEKSRPLLDDRSVGILKSTLRSDFFI
jgi:hypothetical protein